MSSPPRERYIHGYEEWTRQWMAARTADSELGFLLPHLRPGIAVVDCGCGPGSITVGLAERVAPGRVVGVDIEPRQLEAARSLAAERNLPNLEFEQGSVYELPFESGTFDVAVAHFVLEHVSDPLRALKEIRRVLRPGGVAAIKDPYYPAFTWRPLVPELRDAWGLIECVRRATQKSEAYAVDLRALLLEAGFARSEAEAVARTSLGPGSDQPGLFVLQNQFRDSGFRQVVLEQGWATAAQLDEMAAGIANLATRDDLFGFVLFIQALGWVDLVMNTQASGG